ncbi:serine/threonine-protein phosphatase 7 long form-like protein [Trifolium pratense]|uniref:Serine/threonine-protein phosphatase 7 long form-like protein n=1 Tax=Trifolium pratense TaxID=57577 RepID=A0A2K3M171_TRIPR|nr:serine/threonine-protein phosphatase 7 long form-like protein [Trifolium pratense]
MDSAFITALVERWRPETHTFHLPTGECTITLEDVNMLLGLRVDGKAVTSPSEVSWKEDCEKLLGVMPQKEERAYILILIGGLLMPDKSSNRVHLCWLPLLKDLEKAGEYSWGSACLATLYRNLCKSSQAGVLSIGGCALLLQTWGWSRMSKIAPHNPIKSTYPFAKKWSGPGMKYYKTPQHDIIGYRSRIDHMNADDKCTKRKLQFGLMQNIPEPPRCMKEHHKSSLRDQLDTSWALYYVDENKEWDKRHNYLLDGEFLDGEVKPSHEYLVWFFENSKPFVSDHQQLADPREPRTRHPSHTTPHNFLELPTTSHSSSPY